MDRKLEQIGEKVRQHQRLTAEDGLSLLECHDLAGIGRLADDVRKRRHGLNAYYNINRHINYTNICIAGCRFCDFHRQQGQSGAYELTVDDIVEQVRQACDAGATEIHMVGGLHPGLPYEYYLELVRAIRCTSPQVHIKSFTAVEIAHLSRLSGRQDNYAATLADLKDAGLNSMPGGGAEIFSHHVHDQVFPGKINHKQWLEIHHIAHRMGLPSNATILYGHVESLEDRINHLCLLRDAQDKAVSDNLPARFQAVIPLPFIPGQSQLKHLPGPTGADDLKMLATCRLMLDNFEHVKAFWVMQSEALSQLALHYGVDDVDGTVHWYDITKTAGQDQSVRMTVIRLREMISKAGFTAVERDSLYRVVGG